VTRELEYFEEALQEAEAAARWYAERSPTAAAAFTDEIDAAETAIVRADEDVERDNDSSACRHPMKPPVHSDPEIMSGTPVFVGTRVPFQTLIDYLEAGQPLSEFLEDFPTVTKEQTVAALKEATAAFLTRVQWKHRKE
jgi:uncharacterized protein (DUF433 family)